MLFDSPILGFTLNFNQGPSLYIGSPTGTHKAYSEGLTHPGPVDFFGGTNSYYSNIDNSIKCL